MPAGARCDGPVVGVGEPDGRDHVVFSFGLALLAQSEPADKESPKEGESMGPIQDRSKENLVSTDNAIIMARIRLRRAALALQKGAAPPGLSAECHQVRSASFVLPVGKPFAEARADALKAKAGVPHTSI